jgi:hypothetical protein
LALRSDESEDSGALTLTLSVGSAGHGADPPGWVDYIRADAEFASIAWMPDSSLELIPKMETRNSLNSQKWTSMPIGGGWLEHRRFSLPIGRMIARQSQTIKFLQRPPNDTIKGSAT